MFKIRKSVFETNSSSVHSLTICSKEDFEKFKNGELLFDMTNEVLVCKEDAVDEYGFNQFVSFTDFFDTALNDIEFLVKEYETKNGDQVVAFERHGFAF